MPDRSHHTVRQRAKIAGLRAAVHWDALRADPAQYARCVGWRITGKRLRARMKLAPLLGRSLRAYDLWQAQQPLLNTSVASDTAVSILAMIASGKRDQATLESCASEGIAATILKDPAQLTDLPAGEWDWILPLASGDTLSPGTGAVYRAAAASAPGGVHVVYADDDIIDNKGRRTSPHMKPDWNSELFCHFDYLTGATLLRADNNSPDLNGEADWAKVLTHRAMAATLRSGAAPVHVACVLHHRQARHGPIVPAPPAAPCGGGDTRPTLSVIVPTRNRVDLLRVCLRGLLQTEYPGKLEIIVIDNGSDDPATLEYLAALDQSVAQVVRDDGPFNFAALNNRAVQRASGELLCFLNNDIEIRDPHWLALMAHQALREEVGAVGARLLYPDGRIQHAGVVTGIGGAAAHAHRGLLPDEEGYFHRHALPQFVSAVTAACLVISRRKFEAVGGFDAERFPVSFNDVDLCLRLQEQGWMNLYEPRATLVHHESISRGLDRDLEGSTRLARELHALQERWHTGLASGNGAIRSADPFHHRELSPLSEHFVLRL